MVTTLLPDAEVVARQWMLHDPAIAALVGTSVATTLPAKSVFPFVVIQLVQMDRDEGEAYIARSWVQVDVYADTGDHRTSSQIARTIVASADDFQGDVNTAWGAKAFVYGIQLENMRKTPEPATGWSRFTLDMSFMMRTQ